ncbi:MAG: tetratricopeptide repeat protein [Burkholderiales bacterium]|nr:tetratricopeptide repeat protein [Burkholderiales bacterium]
MRSAELTLLVASRSIAMALAAALAGCATVMEPLQAVRDAMAPSTVSAAPATAPATAGATTPRGAASTGAAGSTAAPPAAPAVTSAPADVAVSPESQRAFDDAARALRAGQHADAERRFRSLAQAHPELPGPHANLGLIQRQAGKLPEAVSELETAVRLSPRQPVYWNQLGVTYRQAGQFPKAREAYEKAIALDPGYSAAVLNLGILHDLYLNDGARALDLYGRYLMLQPSGDATVTKWVADLKNRKPAPITVSRKEKE